MGSRSPRRPIRTSEGRVVYDRKKHLFTWRDAVRMLRRAGPPRTISDGLQVVAAITLSVVSLIEGVEAAFGLDGRAAISGAVRELINKLSDWLEKGQQITD